MLTSIVKQMRSGGKGRNQLLLTFARATDRSAVLQKTDRLYFFNRNFTPDSLFCFPTGLVPGLDPLRVPPVEDLCVAVNSRLRGSSLEFRLALSITILNFADLPSVSRGNGLGVWLRHRHPPSVSSKWF